MGYLIRIETFIYLSFKVLVEVKNKNGKEIIDFIGNIFEKMGCRKIKNPAIPTFLPLVIPKKKRWKSKE